MSTVFEKRSICRCELGFLFLGWTYTYEFPAEKMLVTKSALVICGSTPIPIFCMAITYGLEAAVPVADELLERIATSRASS